MRADDRPIRVVLIDDHPLFRKGVRNLLESEDDIDVVAESNGGAPGLRIVGEECPDLVILDVSMPDLNGIAVVRQIRRLELKARALILSMSEERSTVHEALAAGAMGYILKRSTSDNLLHAVRAVHRGGLYVDPAIAERHLLPMMTVSPSISSKTMLHVLSERERDVVRLIAFGFTSKEISVKLGISSKSVEKFKARACEKLDLRTRAAMVRYAVMQDWLHDLPE